MLPLKAPPLLWELIKTRGRQKGQPVVGESEELRLLLPRQGRSYEILIMWWQPHAVRFEKPEPIRWRLGKNSYEAL